LDWLDFDELYTLKEHKKGGNHEEAAFLRALAIRL
jgi:hypothetical protein